MPGGVAVTMAPFRWRVLVGSTVAACLVGAVAACAGGQQRSAATEQTNSTESQDTAPTTLVLPLLQCMAWTDAEPLLRDAGWHGVLQRGEDVTNTACLPNQIGWQDPSPGEVIPSDAPITVRFVP